MTVCRQLNGRDTLWAGLLGLTGVLAGTFAAHGLKGRISESMLTTFEVGVRYHLFHAVAMLVLAALAIVSPWLVRAKVAFAIGVLLFSGSLYALAVTEWRWLGWITPFGGVAFLAGWVCVCVFGISKQHQTNESDLS